LTATVVEDRDEGSVAVPVVQAHGPGLEDRAAAVVHGEATDHHRLHPPAERLRRIGPGEVLIADPGKAAVHAFERPGREDHEGGDVAPPFPQELVVLERRVEVGLAVEDGERDVAARLQVGRQVVRPLDHDRL
jgi:hypothetical protein